VPKFKVGDLVRLREDVIFHHKCREGKIIRIYEKTGTDFCVMFEGWRDGHDGSLAGDVNWQYKDSRNCRWFTARSLILITIESCIGCYGAVSCKNHREIEFRV